MSMTGPSPLPDVASRNRAPRKGVLIIACALIAITAWGKAPTAQIDIASDAMDAPIEVTEPDVVGKFHIWNGPGVRANGKPTHLDPANQEGYFIDWPKGTIEPPDQALMFDVTFRLGDRDSDPRQWRKYPVTYAFRPGEAGGYIHLPYKGRELIIHGVEDNWFRSSDAWEALIRPIIERGVEADKE